MGSYLYTKSRVIPPLRAASPIHAYGVKLRETAKMRVIPHVFAAHAFSREPFHPGRLTIYYGSISGLFLVRLNKREFHQNSTYTSMTTYIYKYCVSMYRLDAEVEETTLFREPRALGCRRPERSVGATKGPCGSLNCVVS